MHGDGWWWHMGGMGFFWILVLVLIVLLAGGVLRSSRGPGTRQESPEEILKRRYAQGEIAKEEYEQRLSDLRK
jgi:putative membrane protein